MPLPAFHIETPGHRANIVSPCKNRHIPFGLAAAFLYLEMTANLQTTISEDLLQLFRALAIAEIERFYQPAQVIPFAPTKEAE
jgi:hypothetical protein